MQRINVPADAAESSLLTVTMETLISENASVVATEGKLVFSVFGDPADRRTLSRPTPCRRRSARPGPKSPGLQTLRAGSHQQTLATRSLALGFYWLFFFFFF